MTNPEILAFMFFFLSFEENWEKFQIHTKKMLCKPRHIHRFFNSSIRHSEDHTSTIIAASNKFSTYIRSSTGIDLTQINFYYAAAKLCVKRKNWFSHKIYHCIYSSAFATEKLVKWYFLSRYSLSFRMCRKNLINEKEKKCNSKLFCCSETANLCKLMWMVLDE